MRNRRPAENVLYPPSARITKASAFLRVLQQVVDPRREIPGKSFRIPREARYRVLIERHQVARLVIDNYFFDATRRARNHRRPACHRLKVDDAEWLVNRRAAKHPRMAVELDRLLFGHHLLNPHYPRMILARRLHLFAKLGCNLGRARSASAQYDLRL